MPSVGTFAQRALFTALRWSGLAFIVRQTIQRRRVTIVNYHAIAPEILDRHLTVLGARYNFVDLRAYVEALRAGSMKALPPRPLAVTIDDGHKTVYELADVFRRHRVRPTVFLCSGIVGTSRGFWWQAAEGLEEAERWKRLDHSERAEVLASRGFTETTEHDDRVALSTSEIEGTRTVFDYQAHTVFHPILTTCSEQHSWSEIEQAKRDLEETYGFDVYAFAYPNGAYSHREVDFVERAGYSCAVTTEAGYNGIKADPFRLRRIGMGDPGTIPPKQSTVRRFFDTNEIVARASGAPAYLKRLLAGKHG